MRSEPTRRAALALALGLLALPAQAQDAAGKKPLRIGIIGAGGMGRTHVRHYLDIGGATIAAVCDPVVAAAEALADQIVERGGARPAVHATAADLLAAGGLDAISVCTPPNDHADLTALLYAQGYRQSDIVEA